MAARDQWDSAAAWSDRDEDRPRPQPPMPMQGGRRTIEVICCPHCDSPLVTRADSRAGDAFARWCCRDCGGSWKERATIGVGGRRAYLT